MKIISILTSSVLSDRDQGFGCLVNVLWLHFHTDKFNIIVEAHNSTTLPSFYILFVDIARFVVEESV